MTTPTLQFLDPRFGLEHRGLHPTLDFAAAVLEGVAIGVGRDDDGAGARRRRRG